MFHHPEKVCVNCRKPRHTDEGCLPPTDRVRLPTHLGVRTVWLVEVPMRWVLRMQEGNVRVRGTP